MNKLYLSGLLLLSLPAFTQTVALQSKVSQAADKIESKVIEWRRDFHEHPELGNNEVRTAAIVAKHLQSLGIEVKTGVAKTGVVGILKGGKPGPVVALRADMDGLPVTERVNIPFASKVKATFNGNEVGVMHACGHDSHVAILMGVAEVLSSMKKDLKGTVKFIFQPAEEGPPFGEEGGAELMVKGKSAHGAAPWASVDPIVTAAQIINNLQTIVSRNLNVTENAGVVTIGSIHGGNRSNIIPEQVEMMGTIRALSSDDEKMLIERIRTIVTKTAESAGANAEVKIPYSVRYPVTYNDPALTEKMLPSLKNTAGADKVVLVPAETGAEDFSYYQEKAPGVYIFLGGMPKGKDPKTAASHHTPDFFIDESGFSLGVKALSNLAIDYMEMSTK